MQVGDLVRWENPDGADELGIIIYTGEVHDRYVDPNDQALVYFIEDGCPSWITRTDIEVINADR